LGAVEGNFSSPLFYEYEREISMTQLNVDNTICFWGVGLAANDPHIYDTEKWRGQNQLGNVLMSVRTLLREGYLNVR